MRLPIDRSRLKLLVVAEGSRFGSTRRASRGSRGPPAHVHPHVMRHAFGDHAARFAGIKNAQALLGHADVGTKQIYTRAPTLDEPAAAIRGIRFAEESERAF